MRELNGSSIFVAGVSLRFVIYDGCVLEQWLIDSIGGERWRPKQIDCSFLVSKAAAKWANIFAAVSLLEDDAATDTRQTVKQLFAVRAPTFFRRIEGCGNRLGQFRLP